MQFKFNWIHFLRQNDVLGCLIERKGNILFLGGKKIPPATCTTWTAFHFVVGGDQNVMFRRNTMQMEMEKVYIQTEILGKKDQLPIRWNRILFSYEVGISRKKYPLKIIHYFLTHASIVSTNFAIISPDEYSAVVSKENFRTCNCNDTAKGK